VPEVKEASVEQRAAIDPALRRPIWSDEEKIRLKGPPHALVGAVRLSRGPEPKQFPLRPNNLSESRAGYQFRLSRAEMVSSSLPLPPRFTYLSLGSPIPSESTVHVPVRFALPPGTAPATYEAVFDIGGEPHSVELQVLPDERLDIAAPEPAMTGAAGEAVRCELLFSNRGNVPLTLDVLGGVVLEDLEPTCLAVDRALAAVRALAEEKDAHRVFLDRLVKDYADRQPGLVRVRVAEGPVTLEPGDARTLAVEFHLPGNLPPGRRYQGLLEYGTGRARLRIDSTVAKGGREKAARPAAAPRASGKEG
jgi:hypothetical protein